MANYLNLTNEEWEHSFADAFFDLFVEYELTLFNKRLMLESDLYNLAYDIAVNNLDEYKEINPTRAASEIFERMKKNEKNV